MASRKLGRPASSSLPDDSFRYPDAVWVMAGDTLRGPDMAVGIVAGYEDSLFGYRILVDMDIGHMFRTTYGIRQTGDIDGGIEVDFHHIAFSCSSMASYTSDSGTAPSWKTVRRGISTSPLVEMTSTRVPANFNLPI